MLRRSIPPKVSPKKRLEAIVRASAVSHPDLFEDDSMIEAALSEYSEEQLLVAGRGAAADRVVEDACEFFLHAWEALRRIDGEDGPAFCGCSRELILVGASQALDLDRTVSDYERAKQSRDRARLAVQRTHDETFRRAAAMREQARRVLAMVIGGDRALIDELDIAAAPAPEQGALARTMDLIAAFARKLLGVDSAPRKKRAQLYGLDVSYIEMLTQVADALRTAELALASLARDDEAVLQSIQRAVGRTVMLMSQISVAFDGARAVSPEIPMVRPAKVKVVNPMPVVPPRAPRVMVPPPTGSGRSQPVRASRATVLEDPSKEPLGPPQTFNGELGKARYTERPRLSEKPGRPSRAPRR